jgi:hypothetical protein
MSQSVCWFGQLPMPPVRDFNRFGTPSNGSQLWRVAHLSNIHVVGEEYGFRIESGRWPSGRTGGLG